MRCSHMGLNQSIPYARHWISDNDIDAVLSVLQSDFLTQGPKVKEFENNFSDYIGCRHAVALANGTAALHLSVLALGLKPGEKVVTTPITFAASANCVLYVGGEVEFVDIDSDTFLMDLNQLEDKLRKGGFRGIIPVDFTGLAVNMEKIRWLADRYGCWILEDSCHALGASFIDSKGRAVRCGNGFYADAAIFSFHPAKHIAAGEGGIVTTNRWDLAKKIGLLRTHGITKNSDEMFDNHGGWYYEMQELGFNYRLSDIHAALGSSQLERIEDGLARRRNIANHYSEVFDDLPEIITQKVTSSQRSDHHAYHLYVIRTNHRKELYDHLHGQGIFVQVHYIPLHNQPYYVKRYGTQNFPNAEAYYEQCLSLPMYPSLTPDEQEFIIQRILGFFDE